MSDDVTRLKIQQLLDEQNRLMDRLALIEDRLDQVPDSPVARVKARQDGMEKEITELRALVERMAYFMHRHTDPLPHDEEEDIDFFPPGCAEMCWRRCACSHLNPEAEGESSKG